MSAAFRGQQEEVEQMKNCLRVLSQPTPTSAGEAELAADQQEREGALELLADLCENMDNAAGRPWLPPATRVRPSFLLDLLCVVPPMEAQCLSFLSGTTPPASSLASQPPASPLQFMAHVVPKLTLVLPPSQSSQALQSPQVKAHTPPTWPFLDRWYS